MGPHTHSRAVVSVIGGGWGKGHVAVAMKLVFTFASDSLCSDFCPSKIQTFSVPC